MDRDQLASLIGMMFSFQDDSVEMLSPEELNKRSLDVINWFGNVELEQIDLDGYLRFIAQVCVGNTGFIELWIKSM